jgi:NADH-quinone oxidoreductase subunit N
MTELNWLAVYPEIFLMVMAVLVAMADLFVKCQNRTPTYLLTVATLGAAAVMHFLEFQRGGTEYAMTRMLVADPMSHLLAFFALVALIVTLVYARPYAKSRELLKGELFSLTLFVGLGIGCPAS